VKAIRVVHYSFEEDGLKVKNKISLLCFK